jgi:hypothetical protein
VDFVVDTLKAAIISVTAELETEGML